ncbi:L,D-transpeptidase family protein [Pedobacter sp. CG_S7]|uniref:L,D-transpeptidase family protein n=1 Tax=Pedobacter sp. CG_S7 TaxID=3143930 RepID=UPI00339955AB
MKRIIGILLLLSLVLQACNWFKETPETGLVLAGHFNNKLYKAFDTAAYNQVFTLHFDANKKDLSNPNTIGSFYQNREFSPEFITHHYVNGDLDTLINYISRSRQHGFNPEYFGYQRLLQLKETLDANGFQTIAEAYPVLADLEIQAAESLVKYYSLVYFGSLNPQKLLSRYYITVKRPDSAGLIKVLSTPDLASFLKEIQPVSDQYLAFQKELIKVQSVKGAEEKLKTILVNMERLRWKLPERGEEYVEVNIPDFSLTWFKDQDTLSHMKVCVGKKREDSYQEKLKTFVKTGNLDDKPKNHETPVLYSKLNSIQVNPIWNIPVSIAQSEIYYQALRDPYYLSNNNIRVYQKGKLVADPDTIQWNSYSRAKLPFQFKQGSGVGNALGKFKFIFDNGSSIYLHDTNNRSAFNQNNRAISHGCVRVEKPLEFAALLVKNKVQYDQLRMEVNLPPLDTTKMKVYQKKQLKKLDTVNSFVLKPAWFGTKKAIPLYINYVTAWWQNGKLQQRADVYGQDETLYIKLKRFL